MKTAYLYWLIFRRNDDCGCIDWDNPTGGLVVETNNVVEGIPVGNMEVIREVCLERYHCGPGEHLIMAEVFEIEDQQRAVILHEQWESEMKTFMEMMNC